MTLRPRQKVTLDRMHERLDECLVQEARKASEHYLLRGDHSVSIAKGKWVKFIVYAVGSKLTTGIYKNDSQEYLIITPTPAFRKLYIHTMFEMIRMDAEKSGKKLPDSALNAALQQTLNFAYYGKSMKNEDTMSFLDGFLRVFKDYVKTERVRGFVPLYNKLMTKYGVWETLFQSMFGTAPSPEQLHSSNSPDVEKIGRAVVQFGETSAKERVNIRATLGKVDRILSRYGLQDLMNCRVVIKRDIGTAEGTYTPMTDHVEMLASGRATERFVYTMIHEYGHRFYYRAGDLSTVAGQKYATIAAEDSKKGRKQDRSEDMSDLSGVMKAIQDDLAKTSIEYVDILESTEPADKILERRKNLLTRYSYIQYEGRDKGSKFLYNGGLILPRGFPNMRSEKGNPVWEYDVYRNMADYLAGRPDKDSLRWASVNFFGVSGIHIMATPGLQSALKREMNLPIFNSPKISMYFMDLRKAYSVLSRTPEQGFHKGRRIYRSDWHVTNYAQTNIDEWFAELFTYYIVGQLSAAQPKFWMKTVIANYRNKIR